MKIYLAGEGYKPFLSDEFYDFYRLASFTYIQKDKVEITAIPKFKDFILDSGIFTYLNGKDPTKVDWDEYLHRYAAFVRENQIKNYVELDIDKAIGLAAVEKLRSRLNKMVGWDCIPVWHFGRGYDKWLEVCKDYSYVCFGAFLTDGLDKNKYPYITQFLNDAKKNNCKVHGLGFTVFDWLKKLPFYSVDSSSWTAGNRYGHACAFRRDRVLNVGKPIGHKVADHRKLASHNFYEWIKFSQYTENTL